MSEIREHPKGGSPGGAKVRMRTEHAQAADAGSDKKPLSRLQQLIGRKSLGPELSLLAFLRAFLIHQANYLCASTQLIWQPGSY